MAVKENSILSSLPRRGSPAALGMWRRVDLGSDRIQAGDHGSKMVESVFLESAQSGRIEEMMRITPAAAAVACVKISVAERLADQQRRKSPVFNKTHTSFVVSSCDGLGVSPMQLESATVLIEKLLNLSPRKRAPLGSSSDASANMDNDNLF